MPTQCSRDLFGFAPVEGHRVEAAFDGGKATSDAGALLLGATDRAIGLVRRFAACFSDDRVPAQVEHSIQAMVMQRIVGIALGYEDLVDHDQLRHDPVLATLIGKLQARRQDCAPLAGKSTLNRLEHAPSGPARYHKIGHDGAAIERLLVDLFLESHRRPPERIILDLDATDDPLHGRQEGRFFHGYYDCYCYLPLYVFCGSQLLATRLRCSNIDASAGALSEVERIVAQIRARWPKVEILLRADSGFARDELMAWCEENRVDYLFGLARNDRLIDAIAEDLAEAEVESLANGGPARHFADFAWRTRDSWSRARRVVAKAEHLPKGPNPRFVVTSLPADAIDGRTLYEDLYCARGQVENRMYGRLPPCKQVSSSFRHAWSAAAMYPASLGYTPAGLDEFRELAPDYQGELEALWFSRALPTPVRPACHRVKEHPRSLWRSRQSRFTQASIRPPRDRLRRGSALPRPSGRAYWPPPLPPR